MELTEFGAGLVLTTTEARDMEMSNPVPINHETLTAAEALVQRAKTTVQLVPVTAQTASEYHRQSY